ncbi:MFS transporter [Parafrankia discariae]|uniref:MFS transporter n=1 Tax=Parafrankia discariae TaxID=365528 RepID=UPI00037CD4BB|nr:MFS transporter [Parafrankia discariae]
MVDVRPLRVRPYGRLWASTVVTAMGSALTAVAVPLQIYQITGSSTYVGLAGLAALGPLVVCGLWGGAVTDVVDRRRMMLVTNSGIALTSTVLWVQAVLGLRSVAVLLGLVAVQQGLFGANTAVRGAVVPRLVPAELLPAANTLQSSVVYAGGIAGPLLAGALLSVIGIGTLYLGEAAALCVTLWAVWKLPPLPPLREGARRVGPREIGVGLGYLRTRPILLVTYLADLIAMLFANPVALFPQVARETFGDPPGGGFAIGVLYAALPAGALCAALLSGTFTGLRRHGAVITAAVGGWGLAVTAFGFSRDLVLAALFLTLAGAAVIVLSVFRRTVLQEAVTDVMRGRMQGVDVIVAAGGPQLGALAHGTAGAALGTTWAISGGGILAVAAMLATVLVFPAFWRYRPPPDPISPDPVSPDPVSAAANAPSLSPKPADQPI